MPRGWTDDDPAKGTPHRRVREKIRLLMTDVREDRLALVALVGRLAEKRPEDVLDALVWLHEQSDEPSAEFKVMAADFISKNDELLQRLADEVPGAKTDT